MRLINDGGNFTLKRKDELLKCVYALEDYNTTHINGNYALIIKYNEVKDTEKILKDFYLIFGLSFFNMYNMFFTNIL
jgi:hypothetical protein